MTANRLLLQQEVALYATELFNSARETGDVERVFAIRDELENFLRIYRGDVELRSVLSADGPYAPEERYKLASGVFADMDPLLGSVLSLMAERGTLDEISRMNAKFRDTVEEQLGVAIVDVTTVVALDDDLRELVSNKVKDDLGKDIILREHIDPTILGGIIMTTQGKRIDASVRARLENARVVLSDSHDGGE
ncbi:MAG: ATP synthase F1 subunit delta [Eggerthellaceae bacterium]|nr:ATP synthase F1 subunit delta [Eggerthellaceae bacterium]